VAEHPGMEPSPSGTGKGETWKVLAVSFFGLGLAPVAPGTFGTFGGIALAVPLARVPGPFWIWALAAVVVLLLLGIALGPWAERRWRLKDPGAVVLDEVAGYLVTVAIFDLFHARPLQWGGHLLAFLLFRIADIGKPPPGRRVEHLPGGWGVMLDDIVVALYSGGALAFFGSWGVPWL